MLRLKDGFFAEAKGYILVGLLLGDGSLEFNGYRGTRLQIKQSAKKREYVEWLFDEFAEIVRTPPQERTDTKQWYFGTRYLAELTELRRIFYHNNRKVVPDIIIDLLVSPISLAVWFMDDGALDYRIKSHYSFSLSTDSFTVQEVTRLKDLLKFRFGITASVQTPSSRGTRYPKIYIGKDGREQFLRLVRPYVLSCFFYKLPPFSQLDPSETELLRAR